MTENVLVIYHADCSDGLVGAWVAQKRWPTTEFHAAKHGKAPPDVRGKYVVLVDFSYPLPLLKEMLGQAAHVTVIDHHKTAIEALQDFSHPNLTKYLDNDRSGAGLAWDVLINPMPGTRPKIVDYVEDRDLWRWKYYETEVVCEALYSMPRTFESVDAIHAMLGTDPNTLFHLGAGIIRFQRQVQDLLFERRKMVNIDLPGTYTSFRVWAVECSHEHASRVGNILAKDGPFGVTYFRDVAEWCVSLRSTDSGADVSEIAKAFGGGGHRNAAGFTCERLPWEVA